MPTSSSESQAGPLLLLHLLRPSRHGVSELARLDFERPDRSGLGQRASNLRETLPAGQQAALLRVFFPIRAQQWLLSRLQSIRVSSLR